MFEDVIVTNSSKCRECYSCVRNCPVKAVKIKNGKAEIIQSRCIQCGNCVKHCSRGAKKVQDSIPTVKALIDSNNKNIALLAPSYMAGLYPLAMEQILILLKNLGFDEIWEAAIGAEYVIDASAQFIQENKDRILLSSPCPAVVSLIEKHYPSLIHHLIPICSPMIATGRIIREKYKNERVTTIFIGPCLAKKAEFIQDQFINSIDGVLTYDECTRLFNNINDKAHLMSEENSLSYYVASKKGKSIPLSGGIISNFKDKPYENKLFAWDGIKNCVELVKHMEDKEKMEEQSFGVYDILSCRGCIDGISNENNLSMFEKMKITTDFINKTSITSKEILLTEDYYIDLKRNFTDRMIPLQQPDEGSIKDILTRIDKYHIEDELNCGACGYESCREKASAVYQGIAEVEMCMPYLLSKKNALYRELGERFDTINRLNEELNGIFESSYDGMIVCDAKGKIVKVNAAWKKMIGIEEIPENVMELEEKRIIYPSATLLTIKEKRRITFLQENKNRKIFIATGNPIYDQRGELVGVVTNIRDIEELSRLKQSFLNKHEEKPPAYSGIIANSREFGKVLEMATQAAKYKSTVLLLGETGVGKDVIARLIHYLSPVIDKRYV